MIIQNVFVKGIHVKTNQESDAAYTDIGTKWKRNRSMNREDGGSIMRKSIKKVLALGIAAVMALSLAACGGGTSGSTQTDGADKGAAPDSAAAGSGGAMTRSLRRSIR